MKISAVKQYIYAGIFIFFAFFIFGRADRARASQSFTAQQGTTNIQTGSINIRNTTATGGQTITSWSVAAPVGTSTPSPCIASSSWITLTPPTSDSNANIQPQNSVSVNFTVNPTGLAIGQYCANVTVTASSTNGVVNSPVTVLIIFTITPGSGSNCVINGFTANGTSGTLNVTQGTAVSIGWTTTNCTSGDITTPAGSPNNANLNYNASPIASGSTAAGTISTANTGATTYTLTAEPGDIVATVIVNVTSSASNTCTVVINSTYQGFPGLPPTGFDYSVSGASSMSGRLWSSTSVTYTSKPTGAYIAANPTNYGTAVFVNITSSANQNCGNNSTITFTYNFNAPPSSCAINSLLANGASGSLTVVQGTAVTISWTTSNCSSGALTAAAGSPNNGGLNYNASPIASGSTAAGTISTANTGATTYTLTAQPGNIGMNVQVTVTAAPPTCSAGNISLTAVPATVTQGASANLNYVIPASCTSANLAYVSGPNDISLSISVSGTGSRAAQTTNIGVTTYQLTVQPGNIIKQATITVNAPTTCTVIVNSVTNGSPGLPPGGFSFTLANVSGNINGSLTSSTTVTYSNKPTGTYTASLPSGNGGTFLGWTPAQAQTCNNNSTVTFEYDFSTINPPQPPGSPKAENSSLNAGVACGQILLTWTAGSGATSYNLYRSNSNAVPGTPWVSGLTTLSYTDAAPLAGSSYYWIQSVNSGGSSAPVIAANVPISPTLCQVNLSTSGKVVTAVNSVPYTYNSTCIPSQAGTVKIIKNGDTIRFNINVCNTGTIDANNVVITDDLTNTNLYANSPTPPNVTITGGGSYTLVGNLFTFNLGTIAAGNKKTITFDLNVKTPSGGSLTLYRFRNVGNLRYTSSQGNATLGCVGTYATAANPCVLDSGYIVFYNGLKAPIIKEVTP